MDALILFSVFTLLMLIGTPIAFCLGAASFATILYMGLPPLEHELIYSYVGNGAPVLMRRALGPEDEALFQRLRELRKELADHQRVPAYIVFSDKVLVEMAARRPATDTELLDVPGVGPAKLEKYGSAFLAALRG